MCTGRKASTTSLEMTHSSNSYWKELFAALLLSLQPDRLDGAVVNKEHLSAFVDTLIHRAPATEHSVLFTIKGVCDIDVTLSLHCPWLETAAAHSALPQCLAAAGEQEDVVSAPSPTPTPREGLPATDRKGKRLPTAAASVSRTSACVCQQLYRSLQQCCSQVCF